MNAAYEAWDPQDKTAEELFQPFHISKQAFFAERRRRGLPPRHRVGVDLNAFAHQRPNESAESIEVLFEMLVEARLRIQHLETELDKYRSQGAGGAAAG